jgi:voltage-gated potassium channel
VGLFSVWPLQHDHRVPLPVRFLVALVGVGVVFALEIQAITRSPRPAIRAVEALAASIPLLLVTFAASYYALSDSDRGAFTEPLSKGSSLYLAVTIFSTVGFGDITPATDAARLAVSIQMLVDLLVLGVGIRVVVGAVQIGRERQAADGTG